MDALGEGDSGVGLTAGELGGEDTITLGGSATAGGFAGGFAGVLGGTTAGGLATGGCDDGGVIRIGKGDEPPGTALLAGDSGSVTPAPTGSVESAA